MRVKKVLALALAAAMAVSMAACNKNDNGSGKSLYPGTTDADMITVDMRAEPPELNSILTSDVASGDILRMCMSGLTKLDKDDQPKPDLAEKWDISNENRTYTFHLRKDAKWTNGEPVTSKDFVYAWTMGMKKETASVYGFILYTNIKGGQDYYDGKIDESGLGIKAPDDYTIEITFENPIPYALHLMSFATYYPMNQKAYESIGADKYGKDADKIVTNGAYNIAEWVHNDHVTMEKNADYYNASEIDIPKVKYLAMKDANARVNALKGGQVDCIDLTGDQMAQLKAEGQPVTTYVDNGNWYFQYNTKVKGLENAKIRQALGMAIDLKSLCDNVRKDGSVPATGLVPTGIKGANGKNYAEAHDNLVSFDATKAKTLLEEGLKEAGMTAGELKLSLTTDDTSAAANEAAFYQEQWRKALGISVEIKPMPFKARLKAMETGDFDIVFAGWSPDYNDAMTYLDMFTTDNGNNYGKYSSAKYDELVFGAMKESDPVKRQNMLIEAETMLVSTDAPIFPLYFSVKPYTCSAKFEGMTRTGFQEFDFTDGAKLVK